MLKKIIGIVGMTLLAAGFLLGPAALPASAGADCDISNFTDSNGQVDLEGYLACVGGAGAGQGNGADGVTDADVTVTSAQPLARTGSDVGSMVGIGAALVILGGAVVYGAKQRRSHTG